MSDEHDLEKALPEVVSVESPFNNEENDILSRNITYSQLAVNDSSKNYGNAAYSPALLAFRQNVDGKKVDKKKVKTIANALRLKADKFVILYRF